MRSKFTVESEESTANGNKDESIGVDSEEPTANNKDESGGVESEKPTANSNQDEPVGVESEESTANNKDESGGVESEESAANNKDEPSIDDPYDFFYGLESLESIDFNKPIIIRSKEPTANSNQDEPGGIESKEDNK